MHHQSVGVDFFYVYPFIYGDLSQALGFGVMRINKVTGALKGKNRVMVDGASHRFVAMRGHDLPHINSLILEKAVGRLRFMPILTGLIDRAFRRFG